MVSTFPPSRGAQELDIARYELLNVSLNGTARGGSSGVYLPHNTTSENVQFYWSPSLSVQVAVFTVMEDGAQDHQHLHQGAALAVIDLVVCALIMPYSVIMELHLITSDVLCKTLEFVRHVSIGASNLTLVAIAMERYMAVCVLTHRLTMHTVNQGMFAVFAVSALLATPSMGVFAVASLEEVENVNCAIPHRFQPAFSFCHFTTSLLGPALTTAYQAVLMIFFFITFIVIVVLYTMVYSYLWKRAKRRLFSQLSSVDVEVTSSNDRPRSGEEGSSQDRKEDHRINTRDKKREKIERQANDRFIICPGSKQHPQNIPEDVTQQNGADRFQGWTNIEDAVGALAASRLRRVAKARMGRHRRTARMLFLCSVVFLVTWLPFWVDVFNSSHNLCLR
ncbi:hypothetical protein ACOMHN_063486 [Nucella lapillus]